MVTVREGKRMARWDTIQLLRNRAMDKSYKEGKQTQIQLERKREGGGVYIKASHHVTHM